MPIGGIVITCVPSKKDAVIESLGKIPKVEVHGGDNKGNIVAVLDTSTSEEMEKIIDRINADEDVLNVGLTYLNTEDEAERMSRGEKLVKPFGFKKTLSKEQ